MGFTRFLCSASDCFGDFQCLHQHWYRSPVKAWIHQLSSSVVELLSEDIQSGQILISLHDHFWVSEFVWFCCCCLFVVEDIICKEKCFFVSSFRQFVRARNVWELLCFLFGWRVVGCHGCIVGVLGFHGSGIDKSVPLVWLTGMCLWYSRHWNVR